MQIPEYVYQIIYDIQQNGKKGYLTNFERLIDPVIIATLYGLYKSRELPPIDVEEIKLAKTWDFNVDISSYANTINHLLFCLWVRKNGSPEKSLDIIKYREGLYVFISKLLDGDYYRNVLIPFYLSKADESEGGWTSFLYRLWNSNDVGVEAQHYSPEYLALEFSSIQSEFMHDIVGHIESSIEPTMRSTLETNNELLKSLENELRFFIQNTLEGVVGKDWWNQAVPPDVREKCKERKEKGERRPGVGMRDYPLIYYADFDDYHKIITRRDNWSQIFRRFFKDEAWVKTKLLTELGPLRNDVAHNRELSPEDAQRLRMASQEVLRCIKIPIGPQE